MTVEYDKMTVGKGLLLLCIYLIPIVIMFVALSHVFYGAPVYSALLAMYEYRYVSYGVGAGVLVALYVSDFALVIRYSGSNRLMPASIAILSFYILLSSAVLRTKYSPYAALLVLLFHLPLLAGIARCSFCSNISPKVFFGLTSFFLTMIAVATLGIWFAWVYTPAWRGDDGTAGLADDMEIYMSHGKDLVAAHGNDVICRASKNAHECNRHLEAELLNSGHCGRIAFGGHSALHKGEMLDFGQTCKAAKSVIFFLWSGPLITFICTLAFAIASFTRMLFLDALSSSKHTHRLVSLLKRFAFAPFLLFICAYIGGEIAGASVMIGSAVLSFTGAGILTLAVWGLVDLGISEVKLRASQNSIVSRLLRLPESAWVQAIFVLSLGVFASVFLALDWITQRMRSLQKDRFSRYQKEGFTYDPEAKFTGVGSTLIRTVRESWHWVDVSSKAMYVGGNMMFFTILFPKAIFIFLAWLHATLPDSFVAAVASYSAVGLILFLLPPVPCVLVYLFGGVIIGFAGACPCKGKTKDVCSEVRNPDPSSTEFETDCIGLWGAIGIAIVVSLVVKLISVAVQQKVFGEFLFGRSVCVQSVFGVHTPVMRAVEKLLREGKGFTFAKIGILCGGPDWITSIIIGIMRLSLPQMLFGILPCVLIIAASVISGALMLRSAQGDLLGALSATAPTIALMLQLLALAVAIFYIRDCVVTHMDELNQLRSEHVKVAEMARKLEEAKMRYQGRTLWGRLAAFQKVLVACYLFHMMIFVSGALYLDRLSFRPFSPTSKIADTYTNLGLNGNAFNIVLSLGWVEIAAFCLSLIGYWIFLASLTYTGDECEPASELKEPEKVMLQDL